MDNNANILVVEDDLDINNLLCRILIKEGYNVRAAYLWTEAKMCMEQYDFHLILLDLMLPGINGEDIIKSVRKLKIMPIIVISAKTEQGVKVEALNLGADDFISKPFDTNEIIARVQSQLRRNMVFYKPKEEERILRHKDLVLNRDTVEVTLDGKPV
ncbi:response regulator, partial [Clostridium perfringens]|nr:response regulator [Clostridium perfringens]